MIEVWGVWGVREKVKGVLETCLLESGIAGASYRLHASDGLILAYHNVVPTGIPEFGDIPLHLPRSRFAQQLDRLQTTHEVVPLSTLLDHLWNSNGRKRPVAAITFDDAYLGAVTIGIEEVTRRGLPATIFVAPGLADSGSFWWDALASPSGDGLSPEIRQWALGDCRGDTLLIRQEAEERGLQWNEVPSCARPASIADLRSAASHREISLGAHGWRHLALSEGSGGKLQEEVFGSRRWLREHFPDRYVDWFAYPYGISSPAARRAVRTAGYQAAVLVEGGWCDPRELHTEAVSRLSVPAEISDEGFRLRLSGLFC